MAATSANVRSRPGEALTASPVKGGAAQFGLHKKRYTDSGTRWQVVAFRAVRDGDLKVMRELAFEQPGLLHDRFTDAMEDWELEFESPKWYQFRDATCLFIACAYARREAVEFLLEFGADRDDKCYMSQRPIDVVGMCREDDMDESYITTILSRPKQPPRAPREPKTTCKLCLEELSHIERYDVPDPDGGAPQQKTRRVSETVARAKVTLDWATEWLKSTLEYELKYRAVNDYDGRSDEKWKTGSCAARRRRSPASCRTRSPRSRSAHGTTWATATSRPGPSCRRRPPRPYWLRRVSAPLLLARLPAPGLRLVGLLHGLDLVEDGRVLQQVGQDQELDPRPADVDVLHLRHAAVPRRAHNVRQAAVHRLLALVEAAAVDLAALELDRHDVALALVQ